MTQLFCLFFPVFGFRRRSWTKTATAGSCLSQSHLCPNHQYIMRWGSCHINVYKGFPPQLFSQCSVSHIFIYMWWPATISAQYFFFLALMLPLPSVAVESVIQCHVGFNCFQKLRHLKQAFFTHSSPAAVKTESRVKNSNCVVWFFGCFFLSFATL